MTRGRGFSSYRGSSGSRMSWNDQPGSAYGSSHMSRLSSFANLDSRSRYHPHPDRYGGSGRSPYDDYHKSYRSELSSSYSGRDHRSPERKRLREEAPRSRREVDSFSSSRYASSFLDRSMRDRRPPPPPTISRRDEFRRPLPPPSGSRGGYRGRLSSRGIRGIRLRDGPPRRRLADSSYGIRRRLPALLSSDYTRRLKVSRLRSAIARRAAIKRRQASKDDSDDEKKSNDEKEKKDKDEKEGSDAENKEEKDGGDAKKKESDKEKGEEGDKGEKSTKKEFIKLVCPHCNSKYITFGKYASHLHSTRHMMAMRQIATKQKGVLARMRLSQRNAQRELEKNGEDLAPRTNFCTLCKLNYKQAKITHQASDAHKNMKKFLMPYCKVCRITFKSPMIYETHICSIEHIKRKARTEINGNKSDDSDDLLEHFMTIDSVGGEDDAAEGKKKEKTDAEGKKIPVNVGIEQIKKVEVHYCDLCRMYLPRVEEAELEKTLTTHCKQRTHLQRYIRYKEDKEIASRAEKLQRKETAEKEREKKDKEDENKNEDNKADESKEDTEEKDKVDEDETMDDKLWADDVNKDLGDILAEAESGNKSSDDEDGERFDRFGTSEKNGDEIESKEQVDDTSENVIDDAASK